MSRDIIKNNFDPKQKEQSNEIKILITTDVLAEGINLHLSNIIVNYDLPWNPTRVLQRVGRVNRLGTKHKDIFIFNFFPTTHSDEHLGLELNITNKIQMFHDILGEDAKYLSDGEEIGSQELFETLNNKNVYTGEEEEEDSELKYLELIKSIMVTDPALFEHIKQLHKKSRSGFQSDKIDVESLVTFFRLGKLKKFYLNQNNTSKEITFFDAVKLLECKPDTKRIKIDSQHYFSKLAINKARFDLDTLHDRDEQGPGRSNTKYIETRLKEKTFKSYKFFSEEDLEFINGVKQMITLGTIAKKTAQIIKKEMEQTLDPMQVFLVLREHVRLVAVEETNSKKNTNTKEIILSGLLTK